MNMLRIRVFFSDDAHKLLLERMIDTNYALSIDYNNLILALRFLFGSDCRIEFQFC